jgi:DNA (cytosine-5)-methyltransferase 1
MKRNHPVYNKMSFPEDETQPARTITATCTRVSRESLVVKNKRKFRRLSVRERASIQGFPINYEFHGSSHSNKLKMIGNAIPPKFTYFLAAAMKGLKAEDLVLPEKVSVPWIKIKADKTSPDKQSKKYPSARSFKFAMPDLNFKSGTRFELNNSEGKFKCFFYYGDSKRIRDLTLDKRLITKLEKFISGIDEILLKKLKKEVQVIEKYDHKKLQTAWSVKPLKDTHPF